jgi:long-chain-fatty-acid--[acyl-carrier-protein] ligase
LAGNDVWQAPTAPSGLTVPLAELAVRERGVGDRRTQHGLRHDRQVLPRVTDVDLSAVRFALNGGEPVDCELTEGSPPRWPGSGSPRGALSPSYGLAESTCAVTVPTPGEGLRVDETTFATEDGAAPRRHAVLGRPIAGMEVRIDPVDNPTGRGYPTVRSARC